MTNSTSNGDYYKILGIPVGAAKSAIKKAFRRLAMKYHPDQNAEMGAAEKFREAQQAYQALNDAQKHAVHDQLFGTPINAADNVTAFKQKTDWEMVVTPFTPVRNPPSIKALVADFINKRENETPILDVLNSKPEVCAEVLSYFSPISLTHAPKISAFAAAHMPREYAEMVLPFHVQEFARRGTPVAEQKLLELIRLHADGVTHVLEGLTSGMLQKSASQALRDACFRINPDAYADKMLPYYMREFKWQPVPETLHSSFRRVSKTGREERSPLS